MCIADKKNADSKQRLSSVQRDPGCQTPEPLQCPTEAAVQGAHMKHALFNRRRTAFMCSFGHLAIEREEDFFFF